MLDAVGEVRGRRLLDIGCGGGVHLEQYRARGARALGVDLSASMAALAAGSVAVGDALSLPVKDGCVDIATASMLALQVDDLAALCREAYRVLVPGGRFLYSDCSPVAAARERRTAGGIAMYAVGHVRIDGSLIPLGEARDRIEQIELVPGSALSVWRRTAGSHVRAIAASGLVLEDIIDCFPSENLRERDPDAYAVLSKVPLFSIFVCGKR